MRLTTGTTLSFNHAPYVPKSIITLKCKYFQLRLVQSSDSWCLPGSFSLRFASSVPTVTLHHSLLLFFLASALVRLVLIFSLKPSWLEASPVTSHFKSADRVCVCRLGDHLCGVLHWTPSVSCQLCIMLFASTVTTDDTFQKVHDGEKNGQWSMANQAVDNGHVTLAGVDIWVLKILCMNSHP